jgi:hypothetical protein
MNHDAEHQAYEEHLNEVANLPLLAEFTQYANDGEAWIHTKIYPRYDDQEVAVPKLVALEASGFEEINDERMGQCQAMAPTIHRTSHSWVVEQVGYANV